METDLSEIVLLFFPAGVTAHRRACAPKGLDLGGRKNSGAIKNACR